MNVDWCYAIKKQWKKKVMKLNLEKTGLVLEGGGMRGVFTSGVLDAFMKHDVYFPYTDTSSISATTKFEPARTASLISFEVRPIILSTRALMKLMTSA